MIELERLIKRVRESKSFEERVAIRLDIVELISTLGGQYATQLQVFSESVIRNKEEWYKKSMTECVHQAGREAGYLHEAYKADIEAAKELLKLTYDMEMVIQDELDGQPMSQPATVPSSISEPDASLVLGQRPKFDRIDGMEV